MSDYLIYYIYVALFSVYVSRMNRMLVYVERAL